jgi:type II secretory pathway pseudopilin PulG
MTRQAGFTMPELLGVAAILTLCLIGAMTFVHPTDYGPARRDAERWTAVAELTQALDDYVREHGSLPPGISSDLAVIGNQTAMLDLCALTPKYLKDLPVDPRVGSEYGTSCTGAQPLMTGYAVRKTTGGAVEVSAPLAEAEEINVTRTF